MISNQTPPLEAPADIFDLGSETNARAGDRMYDASYQPHASRTGPSAMVAVWVGLEI